MSDAAERYPLFCVDLGEPAAEARYRGPFETLSLATAAVGVSEADARIRRCRRVLASETDSSRWLLGQIIEQIEDDSASGEGPDESWRDMDDTVTATVDDYEATVVSLSAWLDSNLKLEQFVCEGDEPCEGDQR
jgi:hypothetical protein